MRHMIRIVILLAIATALIAGCNGNGSNNNATEDLPSARTLLDESAGHIRDASSFGLEIDVSGFPVELTASGLNLPVDVPLQFKYARGVFEAPDRVDVHIQFSLGEVSTTAELIAIDREHYLRGDITSNHWIQEELIEGFTPKSLVAGAGGIPDALMSISNADMLGKTDLDGLNVYHVRGDIEASAVHALTFGLIRMLSGQLQIDVFIEVDDHEVAQIMLVEPPPTESADEEPTTWLINLMEYNKDVSISAPDLENGAS